MPKQIHPDDRHKMECRRVAKRLGGILMRVEQFLAHRDSMLMVRYDIKRLDEMRQDLTGMKIKYEK